MKPKILIIYTGGTIGMIEDEKTRALKPFNFSHLLENVPKIKKLNYDIDNIQFTPPIDSSDMGFEHWCEIASVIERNYDRYDGFVVLHGTDTMAYTASALTFMLKNLNKPVIITGSQLPIGEVRTDGEENLITALQIAASTESDGKPTVREVAILFEDYLWRGCRATKSSADNFNAFQSHNYPPLAKIGLEIEFDRKALARRDVDGKLEVSYGFDSNVIVLSLHPGLNEKHLRYALEAPGLKGVVMRTYGAGNGPTASWFNNAIKDAIDRGIIIFNVTQCTSGPVSPTLYVSSEQLTSMGVVPGHDITIEAAITKMMHLLGQGISSENVKKLMSEPIAGEMTFRK